MSDFANLLVAVALIPLGFLLVRRIKEELDYYSEPVEETLED